MTPGEAEEAKAVCLAAFDERTRVRRDLLARRVGECGAEAAQLGQHLAKELQHLSPEDQATLRQEATAAAFRLCVAQRRAEVLPARAQARRRELEARLAADRRLVAALAAGA